MEVREAGLAPDDLGGGAAKAEVARSVEDQRSEDQGDGRGGAGGLGLGHILLSIQINAAPPRWAQTKSSGVERREEATA